MDTTMELDDLKLAFRTLEQRVQLQEVQLSRALVRRSLKARLRPLALGQILQMVFGIAVILGGVAMWRTFAHIPVVLVCGIILHIYGVATVSAAGVVLAGIQGLDSSLPVVALQRRLAKLRRAYVIGGAVVGLPWWVLWTIPPAVVFALRAEYESGAATAWPAWLVASIAVGVLGLLGTWWFHRFAERPGREALAERLAASATGGSLRRAQAELEALQAFEAEA